MDLLKANSSIFERRQVAKDTVEVSFKRPSDYQFEAGQYSQVIVPELLYPDQKGPSRLFSIASSPNNKERITIAFRDSGSGYKRTLIEAPLGYEIIIRGPFGKDFSLPQNFSDSPVVFIAGGIGITPFLSMISFATENHLALPIALLYANRNKKTAAYLKELEILAERNSYFDVKNKFGRVDKAFIKRNVKDVIMKEYYIAGPPAMVEETSGILLDLGIGHNRLHKERFTGYN